MGGAQCPWLTVTVAVLQEAYECAALAVGSTLAAVDSVMQAEVGPSSVNKQTVALSFRMVLTVLRRTIQKLRHFHWSLPRPVDSTANKNDVIYVLSIIKLSAAAPRGRFHEALRLTKLYVLTSAGN